MDNSGEVDENATTMKMTDNGGILIRKAHLGPYPQVFKANKSKLKHNRF